MVGLGVGTLVGLREGFIVGHGVGLLGVVTLDGLGVGRTVGGLLVGGLGVVPGQGTIVGMNVGDFVGAADGRDLQ
jgi:hypothetical protein